MDKQNMRQLTPAVKARVVTAILKKEKTVADVCREYDTDQSEVNSWIEEFLDTCR